MRRAGRDGPRPPKLPRRVRAESPHHRALSLIAQSGSPGTARKTPLAIRRRAGVGSRSSHERGGHRDHSRLQADHPPWKGSASGVTSETAPFVQSASVGPGRAVLGAGDCESGGHEKETRHRRSARPRFAMQEPREERLGRADAPRPREQRATPCGRGARGFSFRESAAVGPVLPLFVRSGGHRRRSTGASPAPALKRASSSDRESCSTGMGWTDMRLATASAASARWRVFALRQRVLPFGARQRAAGDGAGVAFP
jgi:hypothetical protein